MKKLFYIWLLMSFHGLGFAQISVGWDNDCDYDMSSNSSALQQAIDDGATEVRLSNQNEYLMSVDVEAQITIKGGYSNCLDAENDIQTNINSTFNAQGTGLHAMKVKGIENADVLLDSISLINGEDSGLQLIKNDGLVTLNKVVISANSGQNAGGIYAYNFQTLDDPGLLTVVIKNSVVKQNESDGVGGGITCQSNSGNVSIALELSEGALIHENHAESNGGGIQTYSCDVVFRAGVKTGQNQGDDEIWSNTSNGSGGGISVQNAEVTLIGDQTMAFNISDNESGNLQQSNSAGGGLVAVGSSEVTLINAHVVSNKSQRYGAGIYTTSGSTVTMDVADDGCLYSDYCSKLQSNQLLGNIAYGAAMAATGGIMSVKRTLIQFNNSTEFGYIAHARNDAELTLEGNLILSNGIESGFTSFNGIHGQDTAILSLFYNTTDANLIPQVLIELSGNSNLFLIGNIIDESADILYVTSSVSTDIKCNMMSRIDNITVPMTDTWVATAEFLDQSTFGNYRLDAAAVNAMDVCADSIYLPGKDLSNGPRGIDNPDVLELNGLFDLGAYEFNPTLDVIFADSFE